MTFKVKDTRKLHALMQIVVISVVLIGGFSSSAMATPMPPDDELQAGSLIAVDPNAVRAPSPPNVQSPTAVAAELQLLVDVSGSIDDTEFDLERTGYSDAFRDADVINEIVGCSGNGIAVQLIYWSREDQQSVAVDWTHITDATTANAFADNIDAAARPFASLTAPGSAINFGTPLFTGNGFEGDRLVMDVSGDGAENNGADTSDARDAALLAGIDVINGIVILGELGLETFYTDNVIGGSGAFLLTADTFSDFADAIKTKLIEEVCPGAVGGELLTIDTTALFVAGIFANAFWMIPAIAGIAGTGIYFIKSRKTEEN